MRMPPGLLPTMRSLLLFENAARHQNFSAAAAECCTSQPYVSRIAAGLEREIGFRLFERGHRVIRLTPAGETCHRAVAMGLEDIAAGAYGLEVRRGPQMAVDCGHATPQQFLMTRFVERLLKKERPATVTVGFVELSRRFTGRGFRRPVARRCPDAVAGP